MNQQEEIRIAIAEACGWSDIKQGLYDGSPFGRHKTHQLLPLPDFCNDLNAMQQAGMELQPCDWSEYTAELRRIIQRDCNKPECYLVGTERSQLIADFWFYHATAAQRSEAFCRTLKIGPFKEQPK